MVCRLLAIPIALVSLSTGCSIDNMIKGTMGRSIGEANIDFLAKDPATGSGTYARQINIDIVLNSDLGGSPKYCLSELQTVIPESSTSTCLGGIGSEDGWLLSPPQSFTLSGGDGPKELYLWVADPHTLSPLIRKQTIVLDTAPPGSPTVLVTDSEINNAQYTNLSTGKLALSQDSDASKWCVKEQDENSSAPANPQFSDSCWVNVRPTLLSFSGQGRRKVYVWSQDAAGNISATPGWGNILYSSRYLATGDSYACLLENGGVKCWGLNSRGQLGDGTRVSRVYPTQVVGLTSGVKFIAASDVRTCAILNDGSLKCWGLNLNEDWQVKTTAFSMPGMSSGVNDVSIGGCICAVQNGGVKCWGSYGTCIGDGTGNNSGVPQQVLGLTDGIVGTSVGSRHACAYSSSGIVSCWGRGIEGQLGDGLSTSTNAPVIVTSLAQEVRQISANGDASCARIDQSVYCWGHTISVTATPIVIPGFELGIQQFSTWSNEGLCAIKNGGAQCLNNGWHNAAGGVGNGTTTNQLTPADVSGLTSGGWEVSGGTLFNCGLTNTDVRCWGHNEQGQIGDGTQVNRLTATTVNFSGIPPASVSAAPQWAWMKGSSAREASGTYGTQGVAASSNTPGARDAALYWTDSQGNFWLFGGYGRDSAGSQGYLSDLWKFDGANWTWVGGSNTINDLGNYGVKGVTAGSNWPPARQRAINFGVDGFGNFWMLGGDRSAGYMNDLWRFDGTQWTWISGSSSTGSAGSFGTKGVTAGSNLPRSRIHGVGWIQMQGGWPPNNTIYLFGGYDGGGRLNDLWKFDGTDWTWVAGDSLTNQPGVYGTQEQCNASSNPGSRHSATSWRDQNGDFWMFGGHGQDVNNTVGYLNDLWKYYLAWSCWMWMKGSTTAEAIAVYGTKGVAASGNTPGARHYAVGFVGPADGLLWMLGGESGSAFFQDVWTFDLFGSTNWTWMSGSNLGNQPGVYGTQGVFGVSNIPGARRALPGWVDLTGAFWFFGGEGYDTSASGQLNDLWQFK